MVQMAYSAYDKKACFYLGLFFARNDGDAGRMAGDAVKSGKTPLSDHPEDYSIYRLGAFDDNSGAFTREATPVFIAECSAFVPVVE